MTKRFNSTAWLYFAGWGSSLIAVLYYAKNLHEVTAIMGSFEGLVVLLSPGKYILQTPSLLYFSN